MWPTKDIPDEFLKLAQGLVFKQSVTEVEFIALCKLAVKYIDSGKVPVVIRSHMALYIANIWLNHKNIGDISLLSEIGGQFAEWDREGSFVIEDDTGKEYWSDLKKWIAEADKKYPDVSK